MNKKIRTLAVAASFLALTACGQASQPVTGPGPLGENGGAPAATPSRPVPVHIQAASIGLDAAVERVGLKPDGSLDTPATAGGAAWFADGPAPGEAGTTIIDGHLDTEAVAHAVFWRLHELKAGDQISVQTANGRTYVYSVSDIHSWPYGQNGSVPPGLFTVVGPSRLILITCWGRWVPARQTYDQRLVVTAELAAR